MNLNDPGRTRRSNSRRTNSSEESTRKNPRLVTNYLIELWFFVTYVTTPTCAQFSLDVSFTFQARQSQFQDDVYMTWLKTTLRNSIYSLLGGAASAEPTTSIMQSSVEDIRAAMHHALGHDGEERFVAVTRRIRYANDIQGLWYVRGELMAALSAMHGEAAARAMIAEISGLFQGLLPSGLSTSSGRPTGSRHPAPR